MPDLLHINRLPASLTHSCCNMMQSQHASNVSYYARSSACTLSLASARLPLMQPQRTPTVAQARSTQTRLTTLWQVPPPYIADAPAPCPIPKRTQQLLTKYVTTTAASACPTTHLVTPTAAPADPCNAPRLPITQSSRRRRRSHVATVSTDTTIQRITTFFPQRVLPPHVATNPANSTPDHDPDKQYALG